MPDAYSDGGAAGAYSGGAAGAAAGEAAALPVGAKEAAHNDAVANAQKWSDIPFK